jgi:transposase InsO family protein
MPWQEVSTMSLRKEFIMLASQDCANLSELCRRFGISRKTAYKWLGRFDEAGNEGLQDRSRRPHQSSHRTPQPVEQLALSIRDAHPAWGGRKIKRRLEDLGHEALPSVSTLTQILRRNGRLDAAESAKHTAWKRFEHDAPNRLWQMDFKGHFALGTGRCHPLTVLDDHSRYSLRLEACANEQGSTVQTRLTGAFRRYGLPERMTMDNGSPWGSDADHPYTPLTAWLIRLGIRVSHSRPYHPQTQGKDERFHRTLDAEVLKGKVFRDLDHCQRRFDQWRAVYNLERPHEALGMAVPASRYRQSGRGFPETLPAIEYGPGDIVRKVQDKGDIHYRGFVFKVGRAFRGYPVALRSASEEGIMKVYFCQQCIAKVDLNAS